MNSLGPVELLVKGLRRNLKRKNCPLYVDCPLSAYKAFCGLHTCQKTFPTFGPKAWKYELREHIYHYHATEMQLLDRLSYALEQDACDIFNRLPLSEQRFLLPLEDLEDSEEQHLTHQQQQPRAAATSPLLDATKPEHGAAGSVAPPIPTLSALPQSAAPQPNTSDKQPDTQPDKQPDKQPVKQPDNQPDNLSTQQPDTQPDTQPDKQPDTQHDMQSTKQPELQPLAVLACPFACGKDVLDFTGHLLVHHLPEAQCLAAVLDSLAFGASRLDCCPWADFAPEPCRQARPKDGDWWSHVQQAHLADALATTMHLLIRAKATTGTTLATRIKSAWVPLTASRRCPLVECEAFNNMQASLVAHLMRHMRPCYPNPSGLPSLLLRVPSTALAAQAASDAAAQPLPSQLQLQAPRPPPTPVDLPLACPLCPHGPARPEQGVAAAIMVTHEREVVEQAAALAQLLWVRQQSGQSLSPVAALNPKPVGSPKAGGVAPSQPNSRALAAHLIAHHPHLMLLAAALAKGIALHRRDSTGPEPAQACCPGCGLLLPCSSSAAAAHLMQAHAAQVQQLYFALGSITSLAALSASGGEAAAGQRVGGGCVCPLHCGRWLADDGLSALLHMATAHTRYVWKMAELALQRAGSDGAMSPRRLVDLPRVVPGAMPHAAATPSPVLAKDFLAMVHLKVPAPPSPPRIPAPRGGTGTGRAARQVDDRLALNGASPPSAVKQHRQKVHPPKQHALAGGQEVHPAVQQLQPPLEEDVPIAPGMSREVELAAPPSLAQRARSPPAYRPPIAPASAAAVRSPRSQGGPTASPTPKVQLAAPFSAPHSGAAGTTAEPVAREQRAQGYGEPSQVWTPTAPNCQPPSGHPGLPEDVVLMGTVEALTLPTLPPEALHAVVPSASTLDPVAGLTAGPTSPALPLPSGTPLAPHSPQGPMLPSSAASLSQTPSWSAPSPSHTALPHPLPGVGLAETQPQQPLPTPPSPLHPQPQQPPPAPACALTQSDPSYITQPPAVQSSRPPSPVPAPLPPQPSAPLPPPPSSAQGATSTTQMLYQDPSLGGVPVESPSPAPAPQGPPPTHPSPRLQPASPLQPPTSPAPSTPPPDLATAPPCATSPAPASAPSTSPPPPPLAHPDTTSPAPTAPARALPATAGVVEDRMAPHQLLLSALGAGSTHTLAQPAPLQPASPAQATFTASQAASSTLPLPGPPHHLPTALPLPTPQQQQSTPPAAREGALPPKPSGTVHAVQLPSSSSGAEDGDVVLLGTMGMVAMPTLPAELLSLVSTPAPPSGNTGAEVAAPAPAAVAALEPPPGAAAAGPAQQGPTAPQGRVREAAGSEVPSPPTHPVGSRPPTSPTSPASPVSETSPASSTSLTCPASPLHGTTQDHPTSERQQPPSTQQAAGNHAPGAASGAHLHAPTGKAAAATQGSVEAAKGASSAPVASTVVGLRGGAGAAAGAGVAAGKGAGAGAAGPGGSPGKPRYQQDAVLSDSDAEELMSVETNSNSGSEYSEKF